MAQNWEIEVGESILVDAQDSDDTVTCVAPEGFVVVERARFERVREYVAAHKALERAMSGPGMQRDDRDAQRWANDRFGRAKFALEDGDLDPLP